MWWLLLVSVPVTSFPLVERTIGGETVSPLALAPLLLLLMIWLIPYLLRGGRLPAEVGPLLLFGLVATGSTVLAQVLGIEPYKSQTALSRSIRGLATLGIGVGFYLCASIVSRDRGRLVASLRAIYVGGLVALLWSAAQAWYILFTEGYIPPALNELHRLLSVRDLFWDRVTGLAFEPSWFGNQMVVLYLPLTVGSLVCARSAFGDRRSSLLVEAGLTVFGVAMLLLSRSRISIASFVLISFALLAYGSWRGAGWVLRRVSGQRSGGSRFVARLAIAAVGLVVLVVGLLAVARRAIESDPRTERILATPRQIESIRREHPYESIYAVANRGAFAERLVYWTAGIWPFERYPVLGVGLGNAGFFFEDGLPAFGHQLVEIRQLLDAANPNFPNPKSLWIRLLAETGLVGFASFMVWLIVLTTSGLLLVKGGRGIDRAIGAAGLLAILAQTVEGFSLDTFALPQLWLMMGLLTGAAHRQRDIQ